MDAKIQAMERTNTWTVVPLPPGQNCIGSKWIYKVKYIDRHKARLVAKGYNQQEEIEFFLYLLTRCQNCHCQNLAYTCYFPTKNKYYSCHAIHKETLFKF